MTGRTYRILVVEDNPCDTYIIGEAFKDCGYPCDLTFARSHEEGQRILPTQAFDLLLSDFGTDIEAATAFIQQVRVQAPRLPIVILSGSPNPNIAYEAGAHAFIKKVANLDTFYAKIKGLMGFWAEIAELPTREKRDFQKHSPPRDLKLPEVPQ